MLSLQFILIFAVFVSSILVSLSLLPSNASLNPAGATPFECGFATISSSRLPFSLPFFTVTLIFLVFDLEVALLLPVPFLTRGQEVLNFFITYFVFLLVVGLLYE